MTAHRDPAVDGHTGHTPAPAVERAVARAVALHAEAARLRATGDAAGAVAHARRAVAAFERCEGRRHPDVAVALLELGAALEMRDRWRDRWIDALGRYRRAAALLAPHARSRDPDLRP